MQTNLISILCLMGASFLAGLFLFKHVIPFANRHGFVDIPSSRRRHARPVPIIGGVVVFAVWFLSVGVYCLLNPDWFQDNLKSITVLGPSLLILITLGVVDDIKGLGPKVKLFWQFCAAALVIAYEPHVHRFCLDWQDRVGIFAWFAAVLWLVGISNAVNLVDGLDGLAGGISVLVMSTLAMLSLKWGHQGQFGLVLMVLLIPSVLAFLKYNAYPASIFLGDNGSLPLGFAIGVVSLSGAIESRSWMQIFNLLLMMGYPILDMGLCTMRRYRSKNPLFKADRNHLHHRLLRFGLTVKQINVLILSITAYLQFTSMAVIEFLRAQTVRSDAELVRIGTIFSFAVATSLFSLLYLLRTIERNRAVRLSNLANPGIPQHIGPEFRKCTIVKIHLEPLFEAGLFEEKSRIKDLVPSLILMLRGMSRQEDIIYYSNQCVCVVYTNSSKPETARQTLTEKFKEKLELFQTTYNVQYSLASLRVDFEEQEFMVNQNNELIKQKKAA